MSVQISMTFEDKLKLENYTKNKYNRMLSENEEKHQNDIEPLKEELDDLERELKELDEHHYDIKKKLMNEKQKKLHDIQNRDIILRPNDIVATGTGTMNKNITLYINTNTNKFIWQIKNLDPTQSDPTKPDQTKILNPANLNDFITLIYTVFTFTRDCFELSAGNTFSNNIDTRSGSNQPTTTLNLIKMIYEQPLEHNFKLVHIRECKCNMGHCAAHIGIDIDTTKYKTYGHLMSVFGYPIEVDNYKYYGQYDDDYLCIEQIYELPDTIYDGISCYSKKIPVVQKLDPNVTYIRYRC